MLPWLSDEEVTSLCDPLTQRSAQRRWLTARYGKAIEAKPNGRPLVPRYLFNQPSSLTAVKSATEPDREAFMKAIGRRKP